MAKDTLCWHCKKACGKCSWSDGTFTPVKNWKAKPTLIPYQDKNLSSYLVHSCPEFEDDLTIEKMTTETLAKLMGISKRELFRKYTALEREILKEKYKGVEYEK